MRFLGGFCVFLLITGGAFAQHRGGSFHSQTGASHGIGNSFTYSMGFAGPAGAWRGASSYNRRGNALVAPYAYPVYLGGYVGDYSDYSGYDSSYENYGYGNYGYAPPAAPPRPSNITVIYPPAAPVAMPPAGVPQGMMQTTPAGPQQTSESAEPEAKTYLIAFKDHTIYSAIAYWVDGDTLHYFTSGNTHNQVSLSLVNRALTMRLNKESGMNFYLPPAPAQ